jgi:hypothetical protein
VKSNIAADEQGRFREMAESDLLSLHEGNFARLQVRPSEFAAWQIAWENKELIFPAPEERHDASRDVIVFWGQDRAQRVRCAISREALDDHFHGDNKNKLEVFRENRSAIEEVARSKYLSGRVEPDGTVLIRTASVIGLNPAIRYQVKTGQRIGRRRDCFTLQRSNCARRPVKR